MKRFLFSVWLETRVDVDQTNMRSSLIERITCQIAPPPLGLIERVEVTVVPLPDNKRGIEAATLVELVETKRALCGALEKLESPLAVLDALHDGDLASVCHWLANIIVKENIGGETRA